MIKSPQNETTNTQRRRIAKPPININLTGNVGELVAATFASQREQINRLEDKIDSYEELLRQIAKHTKYPVKLYTVEDFETLFFVKVRTQQNYRKAKKLNFIKPGEKVLYTQEHVDEFIARFDSRNIKNDK
jgi:thiamine monophosphate kinase